ncbi:homoserine kinase [Pseudomarimonas salicorniae]|uniref:Homoserine kinase n=1 Tax=Pseudomarimonas salicorniae TaxID=2933270 RepID=A0ABT0GH91_9GAMM|nr:homoserine kinase [Lysobacter sp. CAU 1642]MCK7593427.1 homoserine kinase [Lysobacter sp. CAU 1642]
MSRFVHSTARAFSPASVGNIGIGFDLLGHALSGAGDSVEVRVVDAPGVRIESIEGSDRPLPKAAEENTAGAALLSMLAALGSEQGLTLRIEKGIPFGSGMGGSAASAVAAVVAANALLAEPLQVEALYHHALEGESVASGSRHGDNVAPMLLGGVAMAVGERAPLKLDVPPLLYCAHVHPHCAIETRHARAALAGHYELGEFIAQSGHLALVLTGLARADRALIAAGLDDVLIEPRRARLIPGFAEVKQAALDAGALGASISGAGPSVFAWCWGENDARRAADAMRSAFAGAGLESDLLVGPVDAPGARVTHVA